jgi:hypothetical protein
VPEHDLKTWPDAFQAVWDGRKTAEFRRDDRGFDVGDVLRLREWDPKTSLYSGRAIEARITHISPGGRSGIPEGFAMLSLDTHAWVEIDRKWVGRYEQAGMADG